MMVQIRGQPAVWIFGSSSQGLAVFLFLRLHALQFDITRHDYVRPHSEIKASFAAPVLNRVEDQLHGLTPGQMLVIGLDDPPGAFLGVGLLQHYHLLLGKFIPEILGLQIHFRELPLA